MPLIREFRQVAKPAELIDALNNLWAQDKRVEQNLRRARIATIVAGILWFAGMFFLTLGAVAVILDWGVFAPTAVVCAVLWWRYSRLNIDDRRILTPIKFLQVLSADVSLRDPVRLVVSFDDYRKHGRKLAENSEGGKKRSKFLDTWLQAEGFLADKTRFRVAITQRVSVSEKRKRKYTLRKERIRELAFVRLRPAEELDAERAKAIAPADGETVAGLHVKSFRAAAKAVLLVAEGGLYTRNSRSAAETGAENLVDGDKLLTLMAAAFDRLTLCRAAGK